MSFLGLFGKKSSTSIVKKHAARAGNRRAYAPDRFDSIQALAGVGTPEAVAALLTRFTFTVDPSIVDQDEKDLAFQGVIEAGGDAALPAVRAALHAHDSLAWPLKCLEKLVTPEQVVTELLDVLAKMDVEYSRDPQKKIQLLGALEDRRDPRIAGAVLRFVEDVNETARFTAIATLFAQELTDTEPARVQLVEQLLREESVRVRARILDAFLTRGLSVTPQVDAVRARLPVGYKLDGEGRPERA